ncbi:Bug family tripartite tricarboxylate transporter substrate binding protein [Roseomonas xinghualingensis]|uniref:Bug family tripartite tricarboxylate transporter substrate binding protein n=1 Tax=Roseomonas xinghualingensis TaxID=2986475 RepID=UPI0021F119F0|nr:tripartite tricarboxylate transporter substrate-binding protein [Roseomonas sp. SXEYE001]MCV4206252.1 tripartite tricarboxylate transporter substrate-binding protein [Roseomonas sp. SXEYE001]
MFRFVLPVLAALLPVLPAAHAQEPAWPSRPITILNGFPSGAGTDIYARKLAEPLSQAFGVPVVVESRTGAGGNIASDLLAKARPDGYTFLLATAGTHAINAALYKSLPFDAFRDVTHIALLGDVPNVLLVNPQHSPGIRSCQDLIAAAKARPGVLNYSSTGNGASTHLSSAQLAHAAGLNVIHVPYRGQGPAMTALLTGEVTFFFNQSGPSIAAVQQGQARALAVSTPRRLPPLPEVGTVAEACDLPGFTSTTWYGLLAPPNLPAAIQERVSQEVIRIISQSAFRDWLVNAQGISPAEDSSPLAFRRIHEADLARWAEVVRQSGATVD